MKYKVIKEYKKYYLCESENGYKVCFDKFNYKPKNGIIIVKETEDLLEENKDE